MALLEKFLEVKTSTIPGAGKGLFTKVKIEKGTRIVEYTGTVTAWKDVKHMDGTNPYIYYVTRNHVIDALHHKKMLARYANDARGFQKTKGLTNNCDFVNDKKRVYLEATKNIPEGAEIFVAYGKEYWDTMKENYRIDAEAAKKKKAKNKT